jgi:hypothetical protein
MLWDSRQLIVYNCNVAHAAYTLGGWGGVAWRMQHTLWGGGLVCLSPLPCQLWFDVSDTVVGMHATVADYG